jgi:AcrR family transcriptional regulator
MATTSKEIWILAGYALFAQEGPKGLRVEVLARQVKKNKSSFYHYFADIDAFTEILLQYHLERAKIVADSERLCRNVIPELLEVLVAFKQDLLFNRQLRVHRDNPAFQRCFEKASSEVGEAIAHIWSELLGLRDNVPLALLVLNLSLENFYLQLTDATLHYEWLLEYVQNLQSLVRRFALHEQRKITLLNATV